MSKVISRLLWFCITKFSDWLTTNGNPNQNQSFFHRTRFPALGASYMYLLRILIGSLCCLLARVITLVLVLRHSTGNRSIRTSQAKLFQVVVVSQDPSEKGSFCYIIVSKNVSPIVRIQYLSWKQKATKKLEKRFGNKSGL